MDADVRAYLDQIPSPKRKHDAESMVELMQRATGQEPHMMGTIVGFGTYRYEYESGRKGESAAAAFAARKPATTVYLADGVGAHAELLETLGPHTTGVGCVYLKDLNAVDLDVLETIVAQSYSTVTSGTFGQRARDGDT